MFFQKKDTRNMDLTKKENNKLSILAQTYNFINLPSRCSSTMPLALVDSIIL